MRDNGKLGLFFSRFGVLNFRRGEIILRADDQPRGVYYLERGFVKLYSVAKTGEEFTLIIFKSGDFFPIMWAINDTPNTYFLEAMTGCELRRVPKDQFLVFIKNNPEVFFELTRKMLLRFDGLLARLQYLAFGNAYNKVASILLICAERFGERGLKDKDVVIKVPLTHQDIADLVGMTRETVSIEMKKLERGGLIGYRGRNLAVKNLRGLRRESVLYLV